MPQTSNPKIVKSLLCFGRVILDQQCNLKAPTGSFDTGLKVDIGGNVDLMATTVNFRNSTIDFDGATLQNFTGNISGNISGNLNVDLVNAIIVNATKFNGNLCGNVVGNFLEADLYTGCVCGDIQTSTITEKTGGGGVTFNGDILGDTVGTHTGPVIGDLCGAVVTDTIDPKTGSSVTITGDTIFNGTVNSTGNITVYDNTKFFVGNVCGNLFANQIHPKTPGGVIDMTYGNVNVSDVVGGNFYGSFYGNLIGNIFPLDTVGNFSGNFVGNSYGKFTGNVCGNVVIGNTINGNIIIGNIVTLENVTSNVICSNVINIKCIESKTTGNIIVKNNTRFDKRVTVLGNLATANLTISGSFNTPPGTALDADICGNIQTDQIIAKTIAVNVFSPMVIAGNVETFSYFIGNLIGDVTGNFTGNIVGIFTGNLSGNTIGKHYGNICPSAGVGSVGIENGDLVVDGDMYVSGTALYMSGTQILSTQQSAISNPSTTTIVSIGGSTGGSVDNILAAVGNTAASDESSDINNNFADIQDTVNDLRTVVNSLRTQFNFVLTALRTHGLIDT